MRKIIALTVLACMFFTFCSCAQQEGPEEAPEYSSSGEIDFMGEEFFFVQSNAEHSSGEEYCGYVVDTEFADLALKRVRDVENQYNARITINNVTSLNNSIITGSVSGIVKEDAVQEQSDALGSLLRTGYLCDLSLYSDYINYLDSRKWGNLESLKPLCWDDCIFGVIPAAWPIHKYRSIDGAVVVNENIIRNLNQTDPREFVEKDEWTWAKLEELMPVYNHINDAGVEVKALYTTMHWLFRTIHTTNGEPVIITDVNGEYQLGLHSPVTFEAMQTAWNWAFGEYSTFVFIDPSNVWENMIAAFTEGKSVLTLMNGTDLCGSEYSIAYTMDNYGVIPFPHGPNGTAANTGSTITTTRFCTAIPTLCKDPAMSAILLNAIYDPLPGYEDDESVIDYLRRFYFFDDRDVRNFAYMYDTVLYNYRVEGVTDVYIGINGTKTMTEWLTQYEKADEANRVKYIVNMESSAAAVFGE